MVGFFLSRVLLREKPLLRWKRYKKTQERNTRRRDGIPLVLLPPWVSAHELKVFGRCTYDEALRQCHKMHTVSEPGSPEATHFVWEDFEGRSFTSTAKSEIAVPFAMADVALRRAGLAPYEVDPEPEWPNSCNALSPEQHVPTVALVGAINHGKTTLIDRMTGLNRALSEPGGITQDLSAITVSVSTFRRHCLGANTSRANEIASLEAHFSALTFLDSPGHRVFSVLRGRASSVADAMVILVSSDCETLIGEEDTTGPDGDLSEAKMLRHIDGQGRLPFLEALDYAQRFDVPVAFCFTKCDVPESNAALAKRLVLAHAQVWRKRKGRARQRETFTVTSSVLQKRFTNAEMVGRIADALDHASVLISAKTGFGMNVNRLAHRSLKVH